MIDLPKMIMIGSNAQNSGKTWLASYLIKKYSKNYKIIAIKAKTLHGNSSFAHFNSEKIEKFGFDIFKEKNQHNEKDTGKMLRAGAEKSFFLQMKNDKIEKAIEVFSQNFKDDYLYICESNNLIQFIKPSLFVLCTHISPKNIKPDFENLKNKADVILKNTGKSFDFDVDRIVYDNFSKKWKIW